MKMFDMLRKVAPLIHHYAPLTLYYSFLFLCMTSYRVVRSATYSTYWSQLLLTKIDDLNVNHSYLFVNKFINNKQNILDAFHSYSMKDTISESINVLNEEQWAPTVTVAIRSGLAGSAWARPGPWYWARPSEKVWSGQEGRAVVQGMRAREWLEAK